MLGRLVVVLLAVLVALLRAEGLARLVQRPAFDLGTVEDWALEDMASTHRPPPNRFGHREAEIGEDLFAPGVTRILVLGDSFTFGQGVHDGAAIPGPDRGAAERARIGRTRTKGHRIAAETLHPHVASVLASRTHDRANRGPLRTLPRTRCTT